MIIQTRIMLYVDDVNLNKQFWTDIFKAEVVEVMELPEGYQGIVLKLHNQLELNLFDREFIRKYSPEVIDNVPSVMFYVDDFNELHQRLDNPGEVMIHGGKPTFNFADPDGNYFAVSAA